MIIDGLLPGSFIRHRGQSQQSSVGVGDQFPTLLKRKDESKSLLQLLDVVFAGNCFEEM